MTPVDFCCDPDEATVPLPHSWEHTIGSDHAAMALRTEYQDQLKRCHDELGIRHVRCHGLLSHDMGTLVAHGRNQIVSFRNAHSIWNFLLDNGMKPFVEVSVMSDAIASNQTTVFHYRGNVTPPKRYADWADLIRLLARRAVDRYGISEVATWPFEIWNEPDMRGFWRRTREQYLRLYANAARGLKEVHLDIPVGGPATAQNAWIDEFLDFSERRDVPVDFVSTHHYPTDATVKTSSDPDIQLAHAQRGILREEALNARLAAHAASRSTTPSGTRRRTRATRCTTSRTPQRSS